VPNANPHLVAAVQSNAQGCLHCQCCAVNSPFIHTAALVYHQHLDATCTHSRHSSAGGSSSSCPTAEDLQTASQILFF
jgi:hypothetical protein